VILGRRFAHVVDAQLALFEREQAGLIEDCDRAERAYDGAPRDEAEERYGDLMDLVAEGTEILAELRDSYASTLEGAAVAKYERAFNRAVRRRLPRFALELEDQ
jgi:hypothetical protein